jgi:lathosterol oxidase
MDVSAVEQKGHNFVTPDQLPHPADATLKPTRPEFRFGEGKISGVIAVFLGWLGAGAVAALHFPQLLSTPEMRAAYPMHIIRLLIDIVIFGAIGLGVISLVLSRRKSRGLLALALGGGALFFGGSQVAAEGAASTRTAYLGLDWFLLSLLGLALVFVPLERLFGRVEQRIFRKGWRTDMAHFGVSHLLVQVTVLLTMVPATMFFHWAVNDELQRAVSSQPLWLQIIEAMIAADLFAYMAHRLFHEVPFLWRFHQIHHSSQQLDWLAGSRLHVVDIIVTRAWAFLPLYVIGFSSTALYVYLSWASFQAVFIHSNVRFRFGPLKYLLATPQFHHWHHSATLYNKNFAVHLPVLDKLFGTYHLPADEWPEEYGLEGSPVPEGYLSQLVYPVVKKD